MDKVFKALADQTRRYLLDLLHEHNGQTLGELCRRLEMTRQSATQHLAVLEAANLVSTVRRGREKLHYLNPVPLNEIQERWIDKFERPRLRALSLVRRQAEKAMEAMADKPAFVYVIYIESTPEKVWHALTDADLTAEYWGHRNVSDWQVGSPWEHQRTDGSGTADVVGTVVESAPPTRLVTTWAAPDADAAAEPSRVTFDIQPHGDIVRLTVTHENLADEAERTAAAGGWAAVLSNLKSLIETGSPLPQQPWLIPQ
ncbi:metalloregulator ArsR/SmtB family transcription factor [Streptomyces sp. NEAU-YJ-81]|uniref:ArsR/SmtB family transcription factor n=1 Tax=Streptomyces sp. NEAU-YJ-81 TaxID=2820288 RepID=UPI001ABCE962|nr:metalloregulator ArsR/SmtB family transcription factor [Streptomyces sp. NEAU-YJ-81]MBO3675847.1 metalloregulator ArsR/SmtB family transcription factor [Streptomyces sp. NEAU-YJ-81]